jgi:4-hydroxybenzoate polyprenyltransferase
MLAIARNYLELIRFSHTVFALPFAFFGAVLAWKSRDEPIRLAEIVGLLMCMVFARSTAMAFNRLVDRRIDGRNPRTAGRHLPAGKLRTSAVVAFALFCGVAFVGSTLLFLPNRWPAYLAVPVLAFICAYSLTKRFTFAAHFWLGASLMLVPFAAWVAIRGMAELQIPIVLGVAVAFWVAGFDILYACQDADFDRSERLNSIPARFGVRAALRIAAGCHATMVVALVALYALSEHLGAIYLAGVVAVAALLVYEHSIVRPDDLTRVNRAFFHVNGVVSIGLFLVVVVQLWFR